MTQLIAERVLKPVVESQNTITAVLELNAEKASGWPFPFCLEEPISVPSERK